MQKNLFNRRKRTFYANDLEYEAAMYIRDWLAKVERCNLEIAEPQKLLEEVDNHLKEHKDFFIHMSNAEEQEFKAEYNRTKKRVKEISTQRENLFNESITLDDLFHLADYGTTEMEYRKFKYGKKQ